jgi:starch-binding outer membrane protein, SusD/RagB family
MKQLRRTIWILILLPFLFASCDSLVEVDSDQYVFPDQYQLNGTNDSIYSLIGVLSQVQKLGDSYVLLGELRADLLDVTDNSDNYLVEINNFDISDNNPWIDNKEVYYSIINNCNYIIQTLDTSVTRNNVKVMYKVYSAAKAIRAWTYLQLVLNYKQAYYYEKALLTVQDAEEEFPLLTIDQLAPLLISDLLPYRDYDAPTLGGIYDDLDYSFFPVRFVLGDLYLWTGQYELAATEYRNLMYNKSLIINESLGNYRKVTNNAFDGWDDMSWYNIFYSGAEVLSIIEVSNEKDDLFHVDSLTINYELRASDNAVRNWLSQQYYYSATLDTTMDLRVFGSAGSDLVVYSGIGLSYDRPAVGLENYVLKYAYLNMSTSGNKRAIVYRNSLLYLRYAEAVNRLGKPGLAMAVLKYGLTPEVYAKLPAEEIPNPLPTYMDFTDNRFIGNVGIRTRGCGNVDLDNTHFIIPVGVDTMTYMEDLIINELALETAFEGNRFQDLMRVAIRRDDNTYLANRVAAKHPTDSAAIQQKLSLNRDYWYLK